MWRATLGFMILLSESLREESPMDYKPLVLVLVFITAKVVLSRIQRSYPSLNRLTAPVGWKHVFFALFLATIGIVVYAKWH